jgi:hypothetical protein
MEPPGRRDGAEALVYGALGGLAGAGAMSVVRMAAHRGGLLDKTVPQVSQEWLADRSGAEPDTHAGHQATQELLHLGYGIAWGLVYAAVAGRTGRRPLWRGLSFGTLLWGIGMLGLLPLLRVSRPAWRSSATENALNVTAHLAYGLATQLLTEELARQAGRRRTSDRERAAARTG